MANTSKSATWSGDSRFSLIMNLNETYVSDGINNYSLVNWNLQLSSSSPYRTWTGYAENPLVAYVNGELVCNQNITYDLQNNTITVASNTIKVRHNEDGGKTISFSASFTDNSNGKGSASLSGDLTLTKINRYAVVTNATNFNDEGNPTINFTNPAGYRINARLEFGDNKKIQRDNIPNTGSYTFDLTQEERELLRNSTPNSNTLKVREVIGTCIGGTTENAWTWQDKQMTIINANPIFNNFDFIDANPITQALTGNRQYNINGYSTIRVTINGLNRAEAQKGARMSKYQFVIGNQTAEAPYSDNSVVQIDIPNASIGEYKVYAIDSRGNSTLVTKLALQTINYEPIFIDYNSSTVERTNDGLGENIVLTYNGTIWNNSFGDANNSITSATYQYQEIGSSTWVTPSSPTTITPTISQDGKITFTGQIRSDEADYEFDLNKSYLIKIIIEDELSSYELTLNPVPSGIPNISLNKNGVGIMCDYNETLGGLLQVGGEVYGENEYSTNEIKTNKIWIDGKPIYRTVFSAGSMSGGSTKAIDISNMNISNITNLYGFLNSNSFKYISLNFYNTDFSYLYVDTQNIRIKSDWAANNVYVILEYTKITN